MRASERSSPLASTHRDREPSHRSPGARDMWASGLDSRLICRVEHNQNRFRLRAVNRRCCFKQCWLCSILREVRQAAATQPGYHRSARGFQDKKEFTCRRGSEISSIAHFREPSISNCSTAYWRPISATSTSIGTGCRKTMGRGAMRFSTSSPRPTCDSRRSCSLPSTTSPRFPRMQAHGSSRRSPRTLAPTSWLRFGRKTQLMIYASHPVSSR